MGVGIGQAWGDEAVGRVEAAGLRVFEAGMSARDESGREAYRIPENEKARRWAGLSFIRYGGGRPQAASASSWTSSPSASASAPLARRGDLARLCSMSLSDSVSVMRFTAAISRTTRSRAAS